MVFLVCAVNCKTYYCFGNVKDKFSCKFVNKKNILINKEKYLDVVLSKHSGSGVNRKFKVWIIRYVHIVIFKRKTLLVILSET